MRALRCFSSLILLLLGLLLVVPGLFIAFTTDWQPTSKLYEHDIARIRAASTFVEKYKTNAGRLPTTDEFRRWAETAPSQLRLDGVGLTYLPRDENTYIFDWYGGRGAWLWWKSNSSLDRANIRDYFIFGSKFVDLLVFLGFGAGALWGAKRVAPGKRDAS
jgi:hypothetical protein